MAVDAEENGVEVIESEEIINGQLHKVTKTVTTTVISDETVVEDEAVATERRPSSASSTSDEESRVPTTSDLVFNCSTPSGKTFEPTINTNEDGTFMVDINASEPGVHTVDVEMNGKQIPGAPFLVRIVQAADPKKVHFYGTGLVSGLLDGFDGSFQVDTKGAGPGGLRVRIHGPRDGFKVEMYRANPEDRVVNVKYEPTTAGLYTVNVLWGDDHAESSPLQVYIADNYEELGKWHSDPDSVIKSELSTD